MPNQNIKGYTPTAYCNDCGNRIMGLSRGCVCDECGRPVCRQHRIMQQHYVCKQCRGNQQAFNASPVQPQTQPMEQFARVASVIKKGKRADAINEVKAFFNMLWGEQEDL